MPLSTQLPFLYISNDDERGRGVCTSEDIIKGGIIEICPVIILDPKDTQVIHETFLHDYYFVWDIEIQSSAIALGYGSLYNHSDQNNAEFEIDLLDNVIRITAETDIMAGDEITLDYKGLKEENNKLWF